MIGTETNRHFVQAHAVEVPAQAESPETPRVAAHHDCHAAKAMAVGMRGFDRPLATRLADRALTTAPCGDDLRCVWRAMSVLLIARALPAADAHCARLARTTHSAGSPTTLMWPLLRAQIARLAGDLDGARTALENLVGPGIPRGIRHVALAWQLETLVRAGELEKAKESARENDLDGLIGRSTVHHPLLLAARGTIRLAEGRGQGALSDFLACGNVPAFEHMALPTVLHWRAMAAFAAIGCGRPDLASSLADDEHRTAKHYGTPAGLGYALYVKAMVADRGESLALLSDAVYLLEVAGARVELVAVRLAFGRELMAVGELSRAADQLSLAAELSRQIGDRRTTEKIGLELSRLGETPTRGTLSPQERRIAGMARAGLSNKEIAARAGLTVRTVEFHLSGVYRKLRVSGRKELLSPGITID
ncbi:hypothetical protein DMC61_39850 [Amycolatopsis sp. WAC 04169]|nr:hypothetical protein DMC61_39850 [Amycolatopsis sp. WAC 04169]